MHFHQHNPEFTMLEILSGPTRLSRDEDLNGGDVSAIAKEIKRFGCDYLPGNTIELSKSGRRMDLTVALETLGGVDPRLLQDKNKRGFIGIFSRKGDSYHQDRSPGRDHHEAFRRPG
jgi:lysyl-tRNA synthetase class 2